MPSKTLKEKQTSYKLAFDHEAGREVLSDLRVFCYATMTTMTRVDGQPVDALEIVRREGRREVFLQIMNMLKVDYSEYYDYEDEP